MASSIVSSSSSRPGSIGSSSNISSPSPNGNGSHHASLGIGVTGNSVSPSSTAGNGNNSGATISNVNNSSSANKNEYESLWDLDGAQLDAWVRSVPTLFPSGIKSSNSASRSSKPLSEEQTKQLAIASVAWKNLQHAIQGLQVLVEDLPPKQHHSEEDHHEHDDDDTEEPSRKRAKTGHNNNNKKRSKKKKKKKTTKTTIQDPYNIYVHAIRRNEKDDDKQHGTTSSNNDDEIEDDEEYAQDIKPTMGGKLSQLSSSGLINGMAGRVGGVMIDRHGTLQTGIENEKTPVPTVQNATIEQLKQLASAFSQAIQTRMETDVLITTPIRIQQMLAPDAQPHEFKAIRRRVYDTVILGKGMGHGQAGLTAEELDIPTAPASGVHDIEKFKKCKSCGNNDQSLFVLDRKNGDVICSNCGTVASESLMHEGSQYRKFEGEADRNHHGDAANPLYSNAHNMSTTLGGVQMSPGGAGGPGAGSGFGKRGLETILRNAHAYTELNISQFGKGDRRTRTGYKDKQKKDAFLQMTHCGDALNLHEAVVQRAKELFAGFRDDRELVQQFKGVIAACLCEAFDQLSSAGRQILKQKFETDNTAITKEEDVTADYQASGGDQTPKQQPKFTNNARANRRNELHHANLAGKGGLLLDFTAVPQKDKLLASTPGGDDNNNNRTPGGPATGGGDAPAAAASPSNGGPTTVQDKVASSWDMDDCRSWLLEASRTIAENWIEERKKGTAGANKNSASSLIPKGASREELEGRMVEHAISLCDLLEAELKEEEEAAAAGTKRGLGGPAKSMKRSVVKTPRVKEMGTLGIKWQHSHERGSGGKGGVGNSGKPIAMLSNPNKKRKLGAPATSSVTTSSGRTAGQLLILKTAKTLGNMLKDPLAGESIHKELRALVNRQAAKKRKEMRDEATRQRLVQMKRKPWLQARAQL